MVQYQSVVSQLRSLGLRFRFLGKPEVRELSRILNPGEHIYHAAFGFYQGGTCLLVATDTRLLLVDKRTLFLNIEDIRYEMIQDVNFATHILDASVRLMTGSKELYFKTFSDARLRKLCNFVQDQITRSRQAEYELEKQYARSQDWRPQSFLLPKRRPNKFAITNRYSQTASK